MTVLYAAAAGQDSAPALLLGASIGTTHAMWDPQVARLSERWRVIRFDTRGHGASPSPPGPYTVAGLAADVVALADRHGIGSFAYCGLSLGGAIGQQLALAYPDRVSSLVLCCTGARLGPSSSWRDRAARVRAEGMQWLVESSRQRWFRADAPLPVGGRALLDAQARLDPGGYAACCDALAAFDLRDAVASIAAPTLVIAGAQDVAAPAEMTAELADAIGATLTTIPDAAHLANVEQPERVTGAIIEHLERTT